MRISNIKVILFFLIFFLTYSIKAQPVKIHNTLKEINTCEGRISLKLLREWGGEVIEDEEKAFYIPVDIEIDRKGYIYVLDQGNNRIQVFNSKRKYIITIGRAGKGPGEFAYPNGLAFDYDNNLIISDSFNRRIQIIDSTGHYISGFNIDRIAGEIASNTKNEILMVNSKMISGSSNFLFLAYNNKGKLIRYIGENKYPYPRRRLLEGIYFDLDSQENIYAAYSCHPVIEKYSNNGHLNLTITYELPFKIPEPKIIGRFGEMNVERVIFGLSVDRLKDRIYLVAPTRQRIEKEKKIGSFSGSISKDGPQDFKLDDHGITSEKTDLYRLLVYNYSGKIIASKQLNVYCDNIKVHRDKLFIVDSYVGMKIYEYRISFE